MRNLERIEKLSSATALGLWAENVILATDRLVRLEQDTGSDKALLIDAAEVLDAAIERSEEPFAALQTTKAVAATDTALDIAEELSDDPSPEKTQETLRSVSSILREVAAGEGADLDLKPAMSFFSAVGKHQLALGSSISGYSGRAGSWVARPMTSNFS